MSFIRNRQAMEYVEINMDVCAEPGEIDTSCRIMQSELSMPVFCAPIAGIKNNYGAEISECDYVEMVLDACEKTGILGFTGDGIDLENLFVGPAMAVSAHHGRGIVTIKPWVKEGIDARLDVLKDLNYAMAAMDIDAAGLPLLRAGKTPVETKTASALKEIKEKLKKPFIVKGVMTVHAAMTAVEAGADAIVVSNHGGRVMDDTPGTLDVLPEITAACKGKIVILIDGGIRTGNDVFKCLALGADGVLIGRPFALAAVKSGSEGLQKKILSIQDELRQAMLMTGCHSLNDIYSDKVRIRK